MWGAGVQGRSPWRVKNGFIVYKYPYNRHGISVFYGPHSGPQRRRRGVERLSACPPPIQVTCRVLFTAAEMNLENYGFSTFPLLLAAEPEAALAPVRACFRFCRLRTLSRAACSAGSVMGSAMTCC